jgi:hypothetical protein
MGRAPSGRRGLAAGEKGLSLAWRKDAGPEKADNHMGILCGSAREARPQQRWKPR